MISYSYETYTTLMYWCKTVSHCNTILRVNFVTLYRFLNQTRFFFKYSYYIDNSSINQNWYKRKPIFLMNNLLFFLKQKCYVELCILMVHNIHERYYSSRKSIPRDWKLNFKHTNELHTWETRCLHFTNLFLTPHAKRGMLYIWQLYVCGIHSS